MIFIYQKYSRAISKLYISKGFYFCSSKVKDFYSIVFYFVWYVSWNNLLKRSDHKEWSALNLICIFQDSIWSLNNNLFFDVLFCLAAEVGRVSTFNSSKFSGYNFFIMFTVIKANYDSYFVKFTTWSMCLSFEIYISKQVKYTPQKGWTWLAPSYMIWISLHILGKTDPF